MLPRAALGLAARKRRDLSAHGLRLILVRVLGSARGSAGRRRSRLGEEHENFDRGRSRGRIATTARVTP